jgi:hypothetical protein
MIHRWRKGANSIPEKETLWNRIRTEILDAPAGQREVWLVLGKTLEKESLLEQLKYPNKRTAVTGQVALTLRPSGALYTGGSTAEGVLQLNPKVFSSNRN